MTFIFVAGGLEFAKIVQNWPDWYDFRGYVKNIAIFAMSACRNLKSTKKILVQKMDFYCQKSQAVTLTTQLHLCYYKRGINLVSFQHPASSPGLLGWPRRMYGLSKHMSRTSEFLFFEETGGRRAKKP